MKKKNITDMKLKYLLMFFKREYFPKIYSDVYKLTGLTRDIIDKILDTGYVKSRKQGRNRILFLTEQGEAMCDWLKDVKTVTNIRH